MSPARARTRTTQSRGGRANHETTVNIWSCQFSKISNGTLEGNASVLVSWSQFCHTDHFHGNGNKLCLFLFSKAGKFKTSMAQVPYNKLLTNLASSRRLGNIGPRSFLYGPRCARSVLSRPRANIPQYGPRARLVRGFKYF